MDAEEGKRLTFVIKSPAGVLYECTGLWSLQLDLRDGKLGIRSGHAAMIAEVSDGKAVLDDGGNIRKINHHSGIVVVRDDAVIIYTDALDEGKVHPYTEIDHSKEEFDAVYEAIMASLLPGSVTAESQYGN